jgi:hypothetical protein
LPIIYKDEAQPEFDRVYAPFEVKGYDYYRNLRNPLLARVTSYQMLFQATRDRPLRIETPAPKTVLSPPALLRTWVNETYNQLKEPVAGLDDKKIAKLCHDKMPESTKCVETVKKLSLSVEIWLAGSERLHDRIMDDVLKPREMREIDEARQDKAFALIEAIDAGKSVQIPDDVQPAAAAIAARFFLDGARLIGLVDGNDRLAAFMLYTHDNSESTDSYITTPRVVVSSAGSELGGVGGHNLSGATPRVLPDPAVPAGAARIVEDASGTNVVHLNPTDIDKTGPVAREFAKRSASSVDKNALQQELRVVLAESQPQRPINAALVIERPDNPVRGYAIPQKAAVVERTSWGWQSAPADGARLQRVLAIANQLDLNVVVSKVGDRFVIICVYCASGQEITALSHVAMRESVVDAIAHGPKGVESRIYFEGFSSDEVSAFKESLAFDGGGMEPPIGPPGQGAAPGDAPRWWKPGDDGGANRRTAGSGPGGGGGSSGGGNGNRGGGGSGKGSGAGSTGNRNNASLLVLRAGKARSSAHEIEIKMAEGSRPASVEEWVAVRREMSRSVDWSDARVEPVGEAQAMLSGQRMSLQLVIPPKSAEPGFQGRLEVQFARDAGPDIKLEVTKAANDEIKNSMSIKQSILLGVTRLVDRLKAIPHVADVRFFLKSGRNDAILSELWQTNTDKRV